MPGRAPFMEDEQEHMSRGRVTTRHFPRCVETRCSVRFENVDRIPAGLEVRKESRLQTVAGNWHDDLLGSELSFSP
jgi:hypothetical protein